MTNFKKQSAKKVKELVLLLDEARIFTLANLIRVNQDETPKDFIEFLTEIYSSKVNRSSKELSNYYLTELLCHHGLSNKYFENLILLLSKIPQN